MAPVSAIAHSYDLMAPFYDRFTQHHDYAEWTRRLEALARAHGLRGRRLLDVGCGTGKSFLPMPARGYDVVACDVAAAMVAAARAKAPDVPIRVCDMRELPDLGTFDLVWSLDDCLNHLLDEEDLTVALRGMAANLAPDGIVLFDLNTLATYRGFFTETRVATFDDELLAWEGRGDARAGIAGIATARLTSFARVTDDGWRRVCVEHTQRHHPEPTVEEALDAAGLCVAVYGQGLDGVAHPGVDELSHTKAVYLARHAR